VPFPPLGKRVSPLSVLKENRPNNVKLKFLPGERITFSQRANYCPLSLPWKKLESNMPGIKELLELKNNKANPNP